VALSPLDQPTPAWFVGRVFSSGKLHVGVRPAAVISNADDGVGVGFTVQVSTTLLP